MKLTETTLRLSNGVEFTIVHNFPMSGPVNTFEAAYTNWLMRTDDYTAESFVAYVKSKQEHGRVCMTLEEHQKQS